MRYLNLLWHPAVAIVVAVSIVGNCFCRAGDLFTGTIILAPLALLVRWIWKMPPHNALFLKPVTELLVMISFMFGFGYCCGNAVTVLDWSCVVLNLVLTLWVGSWIKFYLVCAMLMVRAYIKRKKLQKEGEL